MTQRQPHYPHWKMRACPYCHGDLYLCTDPTHMIREPWYACLQCWREFDVNVGTVVAFPRPPAVQAGPRDYRPAVTRRNGGGTNVT